MLEGKTIKNTVPHDFDFRKRQVRILPDTQVPGEFIATRGTLQEMVKKSSSWDRKVLNAKMIAYKTWHSLAVVNIETNVEYSDR